MAGTIPRNGVSIKVIPGSSEGYHPAGDRPAVPTRGYESGSNGSSRHPPRHATPSGRPPRGAGNGNPYPGCPVSRRAAPRRQGVKGALGFDAADRAVPFSILGTGLLDEVCHLATGALGLLVLACFIDVPRRFYVAGLIASVAIDLDHIPVYLGLLGNQSQRPVTHSLATVLVFAGAAVVSRRHRAVLAGAVTGLVIHSRGTSPRVPPV